MDVYIVAAGGFMFIAESAVRLRNYRGGERTGHSVAWGVAHGIRMTRRIRDGKLGFVSERA